MNWLRKAGAAAIAAAVLLGCGCGSASSGSVGAERNSSRIQQSTSSEAAFTVPQNSFSTENSSEITYFGNQEIDAAAELFAKNNGGTVTVEKAGNDYINKLSEKISADNSPDLCDKVENTYPYLISINMYEDLSNYIDVTAPQWEDMADAIDIFEWNGARYFYPTKRTAMPYFLIYLKNDYVACGNASDPEKLWLRGEWTLTEMEKGAESVIASPMSTAERLLGGDGVIDSFIGMVGGGDWWYVNDLTQQPANKAAFNIIKDNGKYGIDFTSIADPVEDIKKYVFLSGNEATLAALRKAGLTVGIVPYPRYDQDPQAYPSDISNCMESIEGFLVPKGAKNIQGAASFINCSRISSASAEQQKKDDQKLIESGLLRSDVEWLNTLRSSDKIYPTYLETNIFDEDTNAAVQSLFTYKDGDWDDACSQYAPAIKSTIEKTFAAVE